MNEVRQGDVYSFDFGPAASSAPAERHPCLITSSRARSSAPGNVSLRKGNANLPKASVVNVSQVLTVGKDDLVERIGRLPAGTIDAIRSGLQLLFEPVS